MKNKYRTLLSEVLPYETPLFFDNVGFYAHLVTGRYNEKDLEELFNQTSSKYTIPFNYNVQRNSRKGSRTLSVIHPLSQLSVTEFYKKYDLSLLQATIGSPFSLRHIQAVAKLHYDASKELVIERQQPEKDLDTKDEEQTKEYVSYFTYRSIDRMYKFFVGMPLFRLEQKFAMMRKLDVSSCFYHIYTHSVAWAILGKGVAKTSIGKKTLGNDFDVLMQHCNYNETNGIVVGPEVSRIFAEIIFHRIDLNVLGALKERGLVFGIHYEIRRYVDDMMVFANNEKTLDLIESVIDNELAFFKLNLNNAKCSTQVRPFGTPISCCKQDVINLFEAYRDERILNIDQPIQSPYKVALAFFRELRLIVSKYNVTYGDVNRMLLSLVSKALRTIKGKDESEDIKAKQCVCLLDIAYFLFSLDMTTTASLRLCRVIFLANEIAEQLNRPESKQEIIEKLYKESNRVLSIYLSTDREDNMPVEIINILLALKSLGLEIYEKEHIMLLFGLKISDNGFDFSALNYFTICSLLMMIKSDVKYKDVKISLQKYILELFSEGWQNRSELALLFLDLTACPDLPDSFQKKLWSKTHYNANTRGNKRKYFSNHMNRWFFDWNMNKNTLDNYLKKKEYRPAYE